MKVKENEKVGLKLSIQKTKIMASGPIISWEIERETVENSERDGNTRPPKPASWEICVQVRKQQLELDMEQQTGSK